MLKLVEWLRGSKLGHKPFVKSWLPGIDTHKPRGYHGPMLWKYALKEWGIAWPMLGDYSKGGTSVPILNYI